MCIIVDRDYKSQKTALSKTKKEPRAKIVSIYSVGGSTKPAIRKTGFPGFGLL